MSRFRLYLHLDRVFTRLRIRKRELLKRYNSLIDLMKLLIKVFRYTLPKYELRFWCNYYNRT
jgi:hypothetical protein